MLLADLLGLVFGKITFEHPASLRDAPEEILREFSQMADPPFRNPLYKNKSKIYFAFLAQRNILGFQQKVNILPIF